jgi:hypothetical protein
MRRRKFHNDGASMDETINLGDIYDKNLNFLIGSGASYGLFPTLALNIKDANGVAQTLETLATSLDESTDERLVPLFMHYYKTCIKPAQDLTLSSAEDSDGRRVVIQNYEAFLATVLQILQRRRPLEKRCNIFTTNYDGCFPLVADRILRRGAVDFVLNDGSRGFSKRYIQARNFNTYLCNTGVFERHQASIPQINLIHLHGSVYWRKEDANIVVNYAHEDSAGLIPDDTLPKLEAFSACLMNAVATIEDLKSPELTPEEKQNFWINYKKLPIVNPTKWKFHETVFEEHYYQMLRMLSYELEKPNAILITFGFSFSDEHILNLVKRSLSNPSLQVFVCCFHSDEYQKLSTEFNIYRNVKCIAFAEGVLDFSMFNSRVFTLSPDTVNEPDKPDTDAPGIAL